jgi:rod shape determining protein RodA
LANQDFQRHFSGFNDQSNKPFSFYRALHIDVVLLLLLAVLACFGLIVLYSAADQSVPALTSQIQKFAFATLVMILMAQIPPRFYQRLSPVFYTISVAFLLAVLFFGTESKGAQRWLAIPGLPRFQPSEFMKLFMPMMIAWYLGNRILPPKAKYILITLILIFIPTLLIAKQPDLGTSLLIALSGIFVLFLSGISLRLIFGFIFTSLASAPLLWFFYMRDYQKQRVLTLLNPELDPHGAGWNIIQSKTAIGSGGVKGKGWLEGTQSHLDFLPESTTDFIIAVLAEEFGLLGIVMLLVLYLAIVARGVQISIEAQSTYNRLLAGSITLTFFVYVFVNIGMVSGILPIVGVPLPLVSVGGTSLLSMFAGFGVLMSIHTHKSWLSH